MTSGRGSQELDLNVSVQATYRYWFHEPAELTGESAAVRPLVIFLHGKGERGNDLRLLERHGLPQRVAAGDTFPFLIVAPQCPETDYWSDAPALPEFVAAAIARHRADPARVYLTGLSMGGFGVWSLAQRHPERYAAILPVCGGGDVRWASRLRTIPMWVFHGARDEVVPPDRSVAMVEAIRAAGGNPRFTLYPDAAHDSWTETYANPEVYRWLLAQRRAS